MIVADELLVGGVVIVAEELLVGGVVPVPPGPVYGGAEVGREGDG